ncbi:related to beta-1,3-glucan binding protein, partial [Serendipita indica DSM 11827]
MDHNRPSSTSSQEQNPFASTHSDFPDSPSAAQNQFPFHTSGHQHHGSSSGYITHTPSSNSIHQRRNNAPNSRPGTVNSMSQATGDMLTFSPRARDPPPASFMGPPRIGSMASRDSAFAAPPIRQPSPSLNDNATRTKPAKAIPFKSTALVRDANGNANISKPWLEKKDPYVRISYWVTWSLFLILGLGGSGLAIFLSWRAFPKIPNYCPVFEDDFNSLDLNSWNHEIDLGGFGNHQFDMATADEKNSYVKDGKLYITPTLTGDVIGYDQLLDGPVFNLTGCTNTINDPQNGTIPNPDACGVQPNRTEGVMIPPIRSARLTTKGKHNIAYGKVTVRAKLPRGDWLWPAIWMLPEENFYGEWPMSGEID